MSEKQLRIAVFHCGFAYSGGGERIVLEEVNGLRRLGHKVVCYAPTLNRKMCYPDLIKEVGVRTFLPQLPSWFPLRDAIAMALSSLLAPILALGFIGTDVFVGANQPGAWIAFCMARVLGRPYVVYLNQPNRLIYPRRIDQETGWLTKPDYHILDVLIQRLTRFVGWADRISFTEAEVMLANGGYIAGVIESIYGRQQVLCPAGCNPQPREGLPSKPLEAYRGNFEINGFKVSKPYVLITNRHEPQKKFEYVIEAMALTRVFAPEASLVIPGPFTAHTPKLAALATKLGIGDRVLFLGQISETELQRLYREAAIYCYPAPEEDFGMGVIEAMAWGVPVVAWNHAGPTVTVSDGETGYLAAPYSIEKYAQAMIRLLADPGLRARMGAAARERAENRFSWSRHVRILESAILEAVGESVEVDVDRLVRELTFERVVSRPLPVPRRAAAAELAEVEFQRDV
ncbi:MAG TPA: glycosyltransferase family 4 protein [Anaerolineales bacterium]|nr:glycosyltransferase family 4 protein [Anaerolineales bacterium]